LLRRGLLGLLVFLALPAAASAHAHLSPSVIQTGHSETFTVVVPTEGAGTTSEVAITVPDGFQIGSFEANDWTRKTDAVGEGDEAIVSKVTWTGGKVPEGEAAYLRFQGEAKSARDYTFKVRQTYDDGRVENWTPVVTVSASAGGDDGTDALTIAALILGAAGLVLGGIALARSGGRSLT
jgi:uncharacterized protein YcnI